MERKCDGSSIQAVTVDVGEQRDAQFRRVDGTKFDLVAAAALPCNVAGALHDVLIFKRISRAVCERDLPGPVIAAGVILYGFFIRIAYRIHGITPPVRILSA